MAQSPERFQSNARTRFLTGVLLLLAMLLAACGGGQTAAPAGGKAAPAPAAPASPAPSAPATGAAPAAKAQTPAAPAASAMDQLVAAAKKDGSLMIYSGFTDADNKAVTAAFEAKYGIKTEVFRADTQQVLQRFDLEAKAGDVKADVIALADQLASGTLQKQGQLLAYTPPATQDAAFNKQFAGSHYQVVGMTIWPAAWNSDKIKGADVPQDYSDFLKPFWVGKLGSLDASVSLVGLQHYYLLRQALGVEFVQKLGAQKLRFLSPNNAIAEQVVSGELLAAPIMIQTVVDQFVVDKKAPMASAFMKSGGPVLVRTIQIAAKAKKVDAAKLFVNFILSKEGQEAFQKSAKSMPPRSDAQVAGLPAAGSFKALSIANVDEFASKQKELQAEFTQFFKGK